MTLLKIDSGTPHYGAILWDNDGVLVDTERLYFQATQEAFAPDCLPADVSRSRMLPAGLLQPGLRRSTVGLSRQSLPEGRPFPARPKSSTGLVMSRPCCSKQTRPDTKTGFAPLAASHRGSPVHRSPAEAGQRWKPRPTDSTRAETKNGDSLTPAPCCTEILYIMEATYSETRSNFASLWDKVVDRREPLRIHRRGAEDIVMLPASELESLQETAHLLRSPRNAQRLLEALMASFKQEGSVVEVKDLRSELNDDSK